MPAVPTIDDDDDRVDFDDDEEEDEDHAPITLNGAQPTNLSALVEVDQINVIYLTLWATGAVADVPGSTQRMLVNRKQKA